jgi:hypothetical protein
MRVEKIRLTDLAALPFGRRPDSPPDGRSLLLARASRETARVPNRNPWRILEQG